MKKLKLLWKFIFLLISLSISNIAFGQLTGTKTIPGTYATIAAAITDLNTVGVGAGGVTFNIAAGYTETITAPLSITATGTNANPIIFQKFGAGANPLITAYVGTATPSSAVQDGIWNLVGSDYVTIDGIDLYDPNTTNPASMEYGYAMFKAGTADGCQYNTIKNCVVTLNRVNNASGSAPAVEGSKAIQVMNSTVAAQTTAVTPTDALGTNSYNKFYTNTLQNCNYGIVLIGYAGTTPFTLCDFGNDIGGTAVSTGNNILNFGGATSASNPSAGIRTLAQYDINVSYNTINNNNGSGVNHPSTLRGIYLNTAVSANATITRNTLTIQSGTTGSNQVSVIENVSGSTAASNTININYNTITGGSNSTTTSGSYYCIYNSSSAATVNINNNLITNNTISGTSTTSFIETGSPVTVNVNNNQIVNNTRTGASGNWYLLKTTSPTNLTVNNNTVETNSWNTAGSTGSIYGFYGLSSSVNVTISNNIIRNLSTPSTGTACGIREYGVSGIKNIQNNQVYNITSNGGAAYGIYTSVGTIDISKNNIYNICSLIGTSGAAYGVYSSGGTAIYVHNNFISELKAPEATGINAINGIYFSGGTTVGAYYNTIFLNASSTSTTTFGSSGIYQSSTSTGDIRNNIVVNLSTPGPTGGFTVAYRWSGTYNTTYHAATSNNNCFFAGTPSATNLIFYDGTNSDQTIAAYKTRVAPRDAASFSENPPFVNISTSPFNLHLQTTIATQCESGGTRITTPIAITTDFDNNTRWGETGYSGSGSSVDVGADEGNFVLMDLIPPTIVYTPLVNTSSLTARSLVATITDASGVSSGANQPVLYWKINAAASYTGPVAPTTVAGNQYTYNFGSGVVAGDVVSYFIVAQDNSPVNNVGSYPSGATCTNNPPLASAGPTTPSTYTILGFLCGTKTVGTGGDYATLTAAINALNLNELCGPLTFSLINTDYSTGETFPLILNSNPGSSNTNTVTIKPAVGITVTITGSVNSSPILRSLGLGNLIIDGSNTVGGTTRDLTISNTSTTSPQVLVIGSVGTTPITNATVKNCNIINGAQTSSAIIVSDGNSAGTAGYYSNITLQNNTIQKAYIGLYCNAVVAPGNGNGLNITGNDLTATGANAIRLVGLYVQGVDGATVSNNTIGNFEGVTAETDRGIWFATGTSNSTISGNIIDSLIYTGTSSGTSHGISITAGTSNTSMNIINNTVNALSSSGTGTTSGIYLSSTTSGVTIQKNKISNIKNSNTGGYGCNGIYLASTATSSNVIIANNMISDVVAYGYNGSGAADNGYGIIATTGTGYGIYYNTIVLNSDPTATTGLPAAINIASGLTGLDIRNNLFINNQTIGTERYAIYSGATNTAYNLIDNNNYFTTGPNIGYLGANQATIADWRTATGKDVNSFTTIPFFVSATDLHLITNSNCGIDGKGTPIAGITTDYDNDTRNATTPDPGADEFTGVALTAPTAANQTACFGGTIPDLTATVVGTAKWYSDVTLTNLVYTGSPFATGQTAVGVYTYYVIDSLGTCISPSTMVTLTIDDVPAQPSAIIGNVTPNTGTNEVYSVTNVPGVTYAWTFPTGWTIVSGGTTNSVTVTVGTGNGDITCTPSNSCGNGTPSTLAVTVNNGIPNYYSNNNISIKPNPTEGLAILTIKGLNGDINISIKNTQGKLIYTEKVNAITDLFTKTLNLSDYADGMYYIQIENNGNVFVQKIVKQ